MTRYINFSKQAIVLSVTAYSNFKIRVKEEGKVNISATNILRFGLYVKKDFIFIYSLTNIHEKEKSDSFNGFMLFYPDCKPVMYPLGPSV